MINEIGKYINTYTFLMVFVTFSQLLQVISNHIHFGITYKSTEQKNYPVSRGFFPIGIWEVINISNVTTLQMLKPYEKSNLFL